MDKMARMSRLRRLLALLFTISFIAIGVLSLLLRFGPEENHRTYAPNIPNIPIINPRPSVTLRQGTYLGATSKTEPQSIEHFLGIPYALSTGGERRFRPPAPVPPSTESFDASAFGFMCPNGGGGGMYSRDEDCLNANIYRPKVRATDKKLPVLVDVHGGAFNFGSGKDKPMGNMIAWSEEPFIGVTFNYRLGAFGFLPSKLTEKEGLLNLGLKDQWLLFEWVRDNIAEFGGDPDDVTLMGQSAGGHSIGHHIFRNPADNPLFHKVILESAAATARAVYTPSNLMHEHQFEEFLALLDCQGVPEGEVMQKLRSLTTADIKQASEMIFAKYNLSVRWPWQPVIDGAGGMIPIPPIDAWKAGKWHRIPILTGFNTNEGAGFVPQTMDASKQFTEFFHTLLPGLSTADLKVLNEVYPDPLLDPKSIYLDTRPDPTIGAEFKRTEQAYGHFAYVAPVKHTAHYAANAGKTPGKPIYLYQFGVNSSILLGAAHGSNGWFPSYVDNLRKVSGTLEEISGSMHAYWTSFVTTGDPNAVKGKSRYKHRPHWPIYGEKEWKMIVFGEGNDELAFKALDEQTAVLPGDSKTKGPRGNKGISVQIREDNWALRECTFWWDRTAKFEV